MWCPINQPFQWCNSAYLWTGDPQFRMSFPFSGCYLPLIFVKAAEPKENKLLFGINQVFSLLIIQMIRFILIYILWSTKNRAIQITFLFMEGIFSPYISCLSCRVLIYHSRGSAQIFLNSLNKNRPCKAKLKFGNVFSSKLSSIFIVGRTYKIHLFIDLKCHV